MYKERLKNFTELYDIWKKSKGNKQKVIIEKPIEIQNLFKEVTVKGNTQIALW